MHRLIFKLMKETKIQKVRQTNEEKTKKNAKSQCLSVCWSGWLVFFFDLDYSIFNYFYYIVIYSDVSNYARKNLCSVFYLHLKCSAKSN
jgi:hypothetical protein